MTWLRSVGAVSLRPIRTAGLQLEGPRSTPSSMAREVWTKYTCGVMNLPHIPKAPATDVTAAPLLVLAGICLALAVAGVVAIRRRNLILPA